MEDINKKIDEDIKRVCADMLRKGVPALDVGMMAQLMPPFAKMMEIHRANSTSPAEFGSSLAWVMSVMISEFITSTTAPGTEPEIVAGKMNDLISHLAEQSLTALGANFGFTAHVTNASTITSGKLN